MDQKRALKQEKGAIALLDDAAHLLRFTPATTWLSYLLGTLPFILGVLFFCADNSTSPTAPLHLIGSSLGMATLFLWMKCWQTVTCTRLHALLVDIPTPAWHWRQIIKLVFIQLAILPWKFIALPIALFITLPFGWCYAFFQNITCTGCGHEDLKNSRCQAWNLATLWPKQNHLLILILSLFSIFVFANLSVAAYSLPILLKSFLGVETFLSRSNLFLMNSTFWLSMAALTYLCMNPLILAAYVLRCRDGAALATGEDLLSELHRLAKPVSRTLLVLLLALPCFLMVPGRLNAEQEPPTGNAGASVAPLMIPPTQLDSAIEKVMDRIEFTWRLPKYDTAELEESGDGFLARAWNVLVEWVREGWDWAKKAARWLLEWLDDWIPDAKENGSEAGGAGTNIKLWLGLILLMILGTAAALARHHMKRQGPRTPATADEPQPMPPDPDLNNEDILPDEVPESRWMSLAGDCLARGEVRLAVRALHLAAITHLAEKGFLNIARSKSNREYMNEVKRRAHTLPNLIHAFSHNILILEKVWYGAHSIEGDVLDGFLANHKRIMADAYEK